MQLNLYKRTLLNVLTETISIEIVLDDFDETKSSNVQRISLTPVCKKFEERNKRRLPSVFWQGNVAKLWVSCSDPDWQCSERFLVYFWVQNWSYPHEISHNCKKLQTKSTNPVKSGRPSLSELDSTAIWRFWKKWSCRSQNPVIFDPDLRSGLLWSSYLWNIF